MKIRKEKENYTACCISQNIMLSNKKLNPILDDFGGKIHRKASGTEKNNPNRP